MSKELSRKDIKDRKMREVDNFKAKIKELQRDKLYKFIDFYTQDELDRLDMRFVVDRFLEEENISDWIYFNGTYGLLFYWKYDRLKEKKMVYKITQALNDLKNYYGLEDFSQVNLNMENKNKPFIKFKSGNDTWVLTLKKESNNG